jgi:hypothetical protein
MSTWGLIKRIVTVSLMATAFFLLLSVIKLEATPIRPDIRKVLSRPVQSPADFAPARAGWDGPETPRGVRSLNVTYEQISPAATAREVHQSLVAAFIPDYRVLAGVTLVILLLRRIVVHRRKALVAQAAESGSPQAEASHTVSEESTPHAA